MTANNNFYKFVNEKWEKSAIIPSDLAEMDSFTEIQVDIEKKIQKFLSVSQDNFTNMTELITNDDYMVEFIKYYTLISDFEKRDKIGIEPIKKNLDLYQGIESFADFIAKLPELELSGNPSLMPFSIEPDFKKSNINVLWAWGLKTILPDKIFYTDQYQYGNNLFQKWKQCQLNLISHFGFELEDAESMLDDIIYLDRIVSELNISKEEMSDYNKIYNIYPFSEFNSWNEEIDFGRYFYDLIGEIPDVIIVAEEKFWKNSRKIFCSENWKYIKSLLIYQVILTYAAYLTEEIRISSGEFGRYLYGIKEVRKRDKEAFYLAQSLYMQAIGNWYADNFFSKDLFLRVERIAEDLIEEYRKELIANTWLSASTKKITLEKLDKMNIQVGKPSNLPPTYQFKKINLDKTLIENMQMILANSISYMWKQWNKPIDRNQWSISAHTVNALYDFRRNMIIIPAAILNEPFFSTDYTLSQNYGGLGTLIAHEISHAFDLNGSMFDSDGNRGSWWLDSDYQELMKISSKLNKQYFVKDKNLVNNMTISEDIADLAGLICSLNSLVGRKGYSLEDFFTTFARCHRSILNKEYGEIQEFLDVHSPNEERVNVPLSNLKEFHDTFGVAQGDSMWRCEIDRVKVW